MIQNVFDYYISWNKAASVQLAQFFDDTDPTNYKLSVKDFKLDENTAKSIACIIPFLVNVQEVEFRNNGITDGVAAAIVMACFANPSITRISFGYNYLRHSCGRTIRKLTALLPEKIQYLNLMGSTSNPDHMNPIVQSFEMMKTLKSLNLAGCGMTARTARTLG